ncbi:uncharacterized protein [Dermacentor albipictus]|uniref:uncharacterized protein n=1 Tax=Dermacentor albipictus TaxID=60249 RepID=UPI0038FC0E66
MQSCNSQLSTLARGEMAVGTERTDFKKFCCSCVDLWSSLSRPAMIICEMTKAAVEAYGMTDPSAYVHCTTVQHMNWKQVDNSVAHTHHAPSRRVDIYHANAPM